MLPSGVRAQGLGRGAGRRKAELGWAVWWERVISVDTEGTVPCECSLDARGLHVKLISSLHQPYLSL